MADFQRFFALPRFILTATLLSACAPDVAESPHASLRALSRAVEEGDTATTLQYVDLDAIVGRLIRDFLAAARDSTPQLRSLDTLNDAFRVRVDSIERELLGILRTDLGLPTHGDSSVVPQAFEDEASDPGPTDDVIGQAVEIVGDGAVRYRGDTALVERVLRYAYFDTSASLTLAMVPVGREHWRIVALHNARALAMALRQRQTVVLERANRPRRDSIRAYATIENVAIAREPLQEWGRFAAEVRATVANRTAEPLVVNAMYLTGPRFSLGDSVGQILTQPLVVAPASRAPLLWRRPLRGDHFGPYDLVERPASYAIEIADLEVRGSTPVRVRLYETWEEFIQRNPLPPRGPRGVLASASDD